MENLNHFSVDDSPAGARFPGNATWRTGWAWCEWANCVVWQFEWLNNPTGTLFLEGSNDANAIDTSPAAATVIALPVTTGFWGVWPNVVGVPGTGAIVILNPFRWHRVGFTYGGAGGTVNDFKVTRTMRR